MNFAPALDPADPHERAASFPSRTEGAAHRLPEALALLGAGLEPWAQSWAVQETRVRAGTALYAEGTAARALHVVRHGSFKLHRFAEDGYEHVLGFAGVGDLLGVEGLATGRQPLGVMALEDSSVFLLPLVDLDAWRRSSAAVDHALQRVVSAQLMRARDIAGMMAPVASEVRLARFLVDLSQQMAARGQSARRLLLRMSRRDIASLLAVAHETVSRGFGLLADWGYVRVVNREVEILDLEALKACTRSTRRDTDDPHHRGTAGGLQRRHTAEDLTGAPA